MDNPRTVDGRTLVSYLADVSDIEYIEQTNPLDAEMNIEEFGKSRKASLISVG